MFTGVQKSCYWKKGGAGDLLSKVSQVRRPNIACPRSFVEPRSKMMMMGHECKWETGWEESVGGGGGKENVLRGEEDGSALHKHL
jgi:hypothetical protein